MPLSQNLQHFREEKKLSQTELARRVGVTQSLISYIEKGFKTPSLEVLVKICECLDVSTDKMLGL